MNRGTYALAIAIFIGSIGSATILGNALINMKMQDRNVQVRGVAERKVKADTAVWVIPINAANNDLHLAQSKVSSDTTKIINYLKQYNLVEDEISKRSTRVFDKLAQRYYTENNAPRYFVESEIVIKSLKIDDIVKASQNIGELIDQNITIAYDEYKYNGPKFFFTKLNDIKPDMLADATKEARKAANEFALNSKSKVGKIKRASQGLFSILSQETVAAQENSYSYGSNEAYFVDKIVRVIINVEYYLED